MSDNEYKTLEEHNVQVGDVVKYITDGANFDVEDCCKLYSHEFKQSIPYKSWWNWGKFKVISRAKVGPKTFGEMTPEEKGALLLAHHEGKPIQASSEGTIWYNSAHPSWEEEVIYRVKPDEPEVVEVTSYTDYVNVGWFSDIRGSSDTHKITYNIIDGKVDCNSIKMEEL